MNKFGSIEYLENLVDELIPTIGDFWLGCNNVRINKYPDKSTNSCFLEINNEICNYKTNWDSRRNVVKNYALLNMSLYYDFQIDKNIKKLKKIYLKLYNGKIKIETIPPGNIIKFSYDDV